MTNLLTPGEKSVDCNVNFSRYVSAEDMVQDTQTKMS